MRRRFSLVAFERLLALGLAPAGLIIPGDSNHPSGPPILKLDAQQSLSELPLINPYLANDIVHLAWEHEISVYAVHDLNAPETIHTLAGLCADFFLVACFPMRLPISVLQLPRLETFNIHPSLLPNLRGPDPLFWTYQLGIQDTGVTLHIMDQGLDTGPIVAQHPVCLPLGLPEAEAIDMLASAGATIATQSCTLWLNSPGPTHPQQIRSNGQWTLPSAEDFQLSTSWPAERAYHFMRGTEWRGRPYPIRHENIWLSARRAVSFTRADKLSGRPAAGQNQKWIAMNPGWLLIKV